MEIAAEWQVVLHKANEYAHRGQHTLSTATSPRDSSQQQAGACGECLSKPPTATASRRAGLAARDEAAKGITGSSGSMELRFRDAAGAGSGAGAGAGAGAADAAMAAD